MLGVSLLAGCHAGSDGHAAGPPPRPNVLLVVADDMGWGDLSLRGNPNVRTPHLDALAAGGYAFDRFYVSVVCAPTRAELLTGRHAVRYGVTGTSAGRERLDTGVVTLPEVLAEAGYATGLFGKWHNGTQAPYHPLTRGFDRFYGFTSGHWGRYFDYVVEDQEDFRPFAGYLPDVITDTAAAWIARRGRALADPGAAPWFAMLAFPTPHSPMQVPDARYDLVAARGLDSLGGRPDGSPEDRDFTVAALAMVENLDANVGRLVAALDSAGLRQNTLVVFLSDNGPNSWRWNAGLPGKKGILSEGGLRSPLILNWPGVLPQARVMATHTARDLPRTLATLAGLPPDQTARLGGRSMLTPADSLLMAVASQAPGLAPRTRRGVDSSRTVVSQWLDGVSVLRDGYRLLPDGTVRAVEADGEGAAAEPPSRVRDALLAAAERFRENEMTHYRPVDTRPFTVGYPGLRSTWLPVRDAEPRGSARRSSRWPNDSYFVCDERGRRAAGAPAPPCSAVWPVHVAAAGGDYEVEVFYDIEGRAPAAALEVTLASASGLRRAALPAPVRPDTLRRADADYDRVGREESDTRHWSRASIGALRLAGGADSLRLRFGAHTLVWGVRLTRA